MNTHTILNFKTEKEIKLQAKAVADELGLPLGTVLNALLRQFIRDKTVTFSLTQYQPNDFLKAAIKEAEKERNAGNQKVFTSIKDLKVDLMK